MSVHFLIGRSGSGKTTTILERIAAKLEAEPQGNAIILLVPEQGSFQAEHGLVTSGRIKGSVRAQVLSFRRLAYRVMQETGGTARVGISDEGKKMLLYKIIQRRKDELKLFGASGEQLGFVGKLGDVYTEMKRYCVDASAVGQLLGKLAPAPGVTPILRSKLEDLWTVYKDFEQEMSPLYIDEEDNLIRLTESVKDSAYLRGAEIWIDGFHGFTPQELLAIGQMMAHARSVTISLTLDRPYDAMRMPHELDLFHPTATTYIKLRGMAEELGLDIDDTVLDPPVPPRFRESPMLAHLERGYDRRLRYQAATGQNGDGISIHPASGRRAEVEGALREMLRLSREEGVRFREMAVFVRNLGDYEHLVVPLFQDYGVPFFLDQKRSELHHPLAEFMRAALDVVRRYWRHEDVFRCVKSDFVLPLDGSLTREDMDRLENYALASGMQGYRWTDGRPLKGIPSLSLEEGGAPQQQTAEELLELMERCRSAVTGPLAAFEKRIKRAKTARDMCTAVYGLLEDAGVPEKLDVWSRQALLEGRPEAAREHRQLWGEVLDLLDQIVEMMGSESMTFDLFAGMLETGLSELKLGLVPPSLDQVLVGTMDRTRTSGIRHAFLLGVNDGVVPAVFQEDGVITEQERSVLADAGLELAPGISRRLLDERFLIYNALTSASRHVWISYPAADDEGKELLPSEVVRHLAKMFPGLSPRPLSAEPGADRDALEHEAYIEHPRQTLKHLIVQLRRWRQGMRMPELWWDVYNWYLRDPQWRGPLDMLLRSLFYRNGAKALTAGTSRKLYGSKVRTSVSRMERFVACPFSHFASHGLKLRERQLYRLKAPDIGQLFHAALSEMAIRLKEQNRSWGSLTAEECRREAELTVERLAPKLQGEILLSSKRYGYISRKLKNIVSRASVILGEHARRGSFEPVGLELDFGPGKPLPPLTFRLENGTVMEVVGRIDRVDLAHGEDGLLLRVIDYKSGSKDLKLHEVYYGLALQMLTYLDVLLTYAEQWLGSKALPAGTLYFHVHDPMLQSANGMTMEQAAEELLKRFKMKGLLLADRDVVSLMDTSLDKGHSSILPVAVKADGSFYSSASVASPEQWDDLLASVRNSIEHIGTRITEGDVRIEPYRIQQETACTYCPFKPVCQFDETVEGYQYHLLGKPDKKQVWELLSERKGGETH
ncbi:MULTISPECIES: helicase-exonuclease AddAB subunit AddB [Paenibacillus]|uniref:ATP-dependent helicase/deoxyribonuclease subunit B n=1 Tax=Paenibacillus albilobatus TaxID=2716884 RepID=A0A919XNQ4_9BACL|nr:MULTISPECIES: helicase-exonuclease AddAB subunit AddB [Paenibacillus]GIO34155.1 ATP-dependent helicase/deoxyribonuclease subunit B [Paenibacillus albilobatus]